MIPKTDLTHIYRALKLTKDIIEKSPELVNDEEYLIFLVAWQIVNDKQIKEYADADTDNRHRD